MVCPKCKSEFVMGITACTDCQVPLVDEKELCRDCGALNIKYEVCQTCGRVYHPGYRCFNHMEIVAGHVCIICGFQLCKKCVKKYNGRYYCQKHAGIGIGEDEFVQIYATHNPIEAEFLEKLLEEKNIEFRVFANEKFITKDWEDTPNPAEMPLLKFLIPQNNFLNAENFLNNLYHCCNCGVICLPEDDRCYNCGERFE